jgi:hypothetical protein
MQSRHVLLPLCLLFASAAVPALAQERTPRTPPAKGLRVEDLT